MGARGHNNRLYISQRVLSYIEDHLDEHTLIILPKYVYVRRKVKLQNRGADVRIDRVIPPSTIHISPYIKQLYCKYR